MATSVDWLPTILQLCDVTTPSHKIDGHSLVPMLIDATARSPHKQFHWQSGRGLAGQPQWAVREGTWKLIGNPKDTSNKAPLAKADRRFLINLADDIGEARNVADQYPEIVGRLEAAHDAWLIEVNSSKASDTTR
jgi:arylsulfatase A-like enzyme